MSYTEDLKSKTAFITSTLSSDYEEQDRNVLINIVSEVQEKLYESQQKLDGEEFLKRVSLFAGDESYTKAFRYLVLCMFKQYVSEEDRNTLGLTL